MSGFEFVLANLGSLASSTNDFPPGCTLANQFAIHFEITLESDVIANSTSFPVPVSSFFYIKINN